MLDLKHAVQEQGFVVAHIKTDSIKIPDATPEIIDFVKEFGARYGYEFELEKIYDKLCLVNDAVYVAAEGGKWTAVGAQFQHPYVYKTLFSHELTTFDDLCEVKQVSKGAIYIDLEYDRPMVLVSGKTDGMHFVGRTGRFVPVLSNGGILYRVHEGKHYAIAGTKGYFWMEAELFLDQENQGKFSEIDMSYFDNLVHDAIKTINKFGDFEELVK
jgi:hypothetical protein